jgi:hypothetical protein
VPVKTFVTAEDFDREVSLFTGEAIENPSVARGRTPGKLEEEFVMAPFSVWSARDGRWQSRKKAWLDLGIQSEIGRGVLLTVGMSQDGQWEGRPDDALRAQRAACPGGSHLPAANYGKSRARGNGAGRPVDPNGVTFATSAQPKEVYRAKNAYEATLGRSVTWEEFYAAFPDAASVGGTSVFDPVICELVYRWFSPLRSRVLDPFAGGSVRGIVAAKLGREYTGVELSAAQVEANREQCAAICAGDEFAPRWICDDAANVGTRDDIPAADLVFSCPPYADLERYSEDPRDLSTMEYPAFLNAYRRIIAAACGRLCHNRFAVFVVGDVRDGGGFYRNLAGDTVEAFRAAGLRYYNEAVLVTAVASLAVRAGAQFRGSRKLGRTHQNVLVFVKGDPEAAAAACGPVCAE